MLSSTYNVTDIVAAIESFFSTRFLSSSMYWVDYLPSKIEFSDVIKISAAALVMSWLATLYPAWRASRIVPAEALRYE